MIVQNPPAPPLSAAELDHIYELPFSRRTHPSYPEPVPALEPVQFSVVSHRGCFGSCSFCALTHHQGRIIQSRSIGSIVREVTRMAVMPEFKGIVKDVGGPTANMYGTECDRWGTAGACPDMSCSPACPTLRTSHRKLADLLKRISDVPGVKKVFVSSGIRYDLVLADDSGSRYLDDLCDCHVSGHLKVAPEHISPHVTEAMNKPDGSVFDRFVNRFEALQKGKPKRQYLVPYFMSGHPGCTVSDMVELAEYIRDRGLYTEQVQDFTPTPMSVSTSMYYTGLNPFTLEPVHVPKGREKRIQRALMQYREPQNRGLVLEGLRMAGREDLIGSGKKCLVAGESRDHRFRRAGSTTEISQCRIAVIIRDHENHPQKGKGPILLPAVIILEPDDIVFFKILAQLHLDHFERDHTGIFEPVPDPAPDKRTLSLPEQFCFAVKFHFGRPAHDHPVLAPVVVELEGEFLPGLDRHTLDLVAVRILKHSVGSPGPVDLPVEPGDRVVLFFEPSDEVLDLLRASVIAYEECIGRVHYHEVVHAD